MQQNYDQEDEIDLKQLVNTLADRKKFIFKFTGTVTILAILYALLVTPTYETSISFVSPTNDSIALLNKTKLTKFTKQEVYKEFLNLFNSRKFQREVFNSKDYLSKFNINNDPIDNVSTFFAEEVIESLRQNIIKINKNEEKSINELPISFSFEGSDAKHTSDYLNDIAIQANTKVITKSLQQIQQKIDIRLEEIALEKSLLLKKAKSDRLSKISTIEEADQQKINEINDQIARLRTKIKRERLNRIVILKDMADTARALGIKENNFRSNSKADSSTLAVSINENNKLPKWYLYGEDALIKDINILENRKNDDPYIPQLVDLNNQLKKIRSNQLLQTLKNRKDDSPFIAKLNTLDNESIKLKSFILDATDINAMQLHQASFPPEKPIKPKKKLIVIVALIAGFILSIFLVFIMSAFRKEEDKVAV